MESPEDVKLKRRVLCALPTTHLRSRCGEVIQETYAKMHPSFRNEPEIYGTLWRVRPSLKYAILRSCNRALTGRIGLNHYAASNLMDLLLGCSKRGHL